jgi:hypothetical protein
MQTESRTDFLNTDLPMEQLFYRLRDRFDRVAGDDAGFRAGTLEDAIAHMRTRMGAVARLIRRQAGNRTNA